MNDERLPSMKNIKIWLTYHGAHEGRGSIQRCGNIYTLHLSWLRRGARTEITSTLHEVKRVCRALMVMDDWDFRANQ